MNHKKKEPRNRIMLYALSTCVWCKKTKALLNELKVEYSFLYVDLLEDEEKQKTKKDLERWNPRCTFPTLVINNEKAIVGYKPQEIKEALGYE